MAATVEFTSRGDGAYTVYVDSLPIAVVVRVEDRWQGITTDGRHATAGGSRKEVTEWLVAHHK
jgi:hypothetical protein